MPTDPVWVVNFEALPERDAPDEDSAFLWTWAGLGTPISIHYWPCRL